MRTQEREWSDYARAVRQVARARSDAQQAQDRVTANRSRAEATALAGAEAMAERGRRLEERLGELAEKATSSLERAGVGVEGKRVVVSLPTLGEIADVEAAAVRLTKALGDTVERLEETRARARAERERRRRRTLTAVLVLIAFALVWSIDRSLLDALVAAAIVLVTLVTAPRLTGAFWVGLGASAVVVILLAAGLPWWSAILVPAIVAGSAFAAPKKSTVTRK